MTPEILFTLLNPAMAAVYAAVFFTLWVYRRQSRYLLVLVGCYVSIALYFVLQAVDLPWGPAPTRAFTNVFNLIYVFALVVAFCWRAEVRFPKKIIGGTLLASYAGYLWFLFASPDPVVRICLINGAISIAMLATAMTIYGSARNVADRFLFGLLLLYAFISIARPVLTLPYDSITAQTDLRLTTYWTVYSFTHAIISLLMVFGLTTAVALDSITELTRATFTDTLSGLMNRRGFESAAAERLERARARHLPLSLIICDLDYFKSINDTFGHHVGDRVIVSFAHVLNYVVGDAHVIGRIGGEEFAVLIDGGDSRMAELIAQGVRVGFSSAPAPGAERRLTASFGIAQLQPEESFEHLIGRADAALYQAKANGRDCVFLSRPSQPEPGIRAATFGLAVTT